MGATRTKKKQVAASSAPDSDKSFSNVLKFSAVIAILALVYGTTGVQQYNNADSMIPKPARNVKSVLHHTLQVVSEHKHDTTAFTQGLLYHNGVLIESTGLWEGKSSVRHVELESGRVLKKVGLPDPSLFGEGLALRQGKLYQLTYKSQKVLVYDAWSLELLEEFEFKSESGEGWGLVYDLKSDQFVMSDGSAVLQFLHPDSFQEIRRVYVHLVDGQGESKLIPSVNELEIVHGEIWANIFGTHKIVRISPVNGLVLGILHCDFLGSNLNREADVFNGIALLPGNYTNFNDSKVALAVTGKQWNALYVVTVDVELEDDE